MSILFCRLFACFFGAYRNGEVGGYNRIKSRDDKSCDSKPIWGKKNKTWLRITPLFYILLFVFYKTIGGTCSILNL